VTKKAVQSKTVEQSKRKLPVKTQMKIPVYADVLLARDMFHFLVFRVVQSPNHVKQKIQTTKTIPRPKHDS